MVSNTKIEKITSPLVNVIMIAIYYQIILIFGDSVLLGGFEPIEELFDVFGVDKTIV